MTQQFEMVTATVGKENRLATLKSNLAAEEKSPDRSQLYVDDLKDSIQRLEQTKRLHTIGKLEGSY